MRTFCALLACAAVGATALADHVPGHSDGDPTFPIPLPGPDFFTGGALFGTFIGPVGGTQVTNTTFDITFVSDGATPASDLVIDISLQVDNDFREFHVTGADLGFGSGPGTFSGTLSTDFLNGTIWQGFLFPHSIVDVYIGATTGGIDGVVQFENSFIILDVIPVPEPGALAGLSLLGAFLLRRNR